MKFLRYISLLIIALVTSIASAQVKFEAKASKTKLGINERLRIDFEMNKDGDNFNPPSFENFTVVGGPSQSISQSWINGKESFSQSYTYIIKPLKKGEFLIPAASIKLNDQVIIQPNVYYSRQAGSWEAVGGVAALYNVSGDGEYTLSAGAYYRLSESMIPQVGLGLRQLQFTFSYDVTASTLKNFTNRRGAFELSITKQGIADPYRGNRQQSLCPTFR